MDNLPEIVSQLLQRTKENKVVWETTVDNQVFLATLSSASVRMSQTLNRFDLYDVFLSVIDDYGHVLESIDTRGLEDSLNSDLTELYELARQSALGIKKKLEELLRELEQTA